MSGLVLDPTRVAGTLAFGTAALACLRAGALAPRRAVTWWILAALQVACVVEVLLGTRYGLHEALNRVLQARGWYASRGQWQAELLAATLALIAGAMLYSAWRHRDDAAATLAIVGTAMGVALFVAETISLHRIDAVMYAEVGPLVVLAWMWIATSAFVIVAALARRG
jgi:hypothetical protein